MKKEKVKVIQRGVEELWASKWSGYKEVQLGTKNPVSLLIIRHDSVLTGMNWLSYIFFPAEKFIKKIIAITETLRSWSCPYGNLWGQTFMLGTNFAMTLQGAGRKYAII